jgi:hypothetical protein
VLIERAFPKEMRIWMSGDSPALLQWSLSTRAKPEGGTFDREAMRAGHLVAVEAYTKPSEEKQRLRWEELPENVRFVTSPLVLNYHRVFLVPNDQPIETHVSGRQPYDSALLLHSVGHGDVLRPENSGDTSVSPKVQFAQPSEIRLPATITVQLEAGASIGTCNLIFSQSLQDKRISASTNTSGAWEASSNVFILGELASIALTREGCKAIRIDVGSDPSLTSRTRDMARPPFGLLEAWVAPGNARLP